MKQQVNLLQSESEVNRVSLSLDNLLLGAIMLIVVLGALYWFEDRSVGVLEKDISTLESQVAARNKTISTINQSLKDDEPIKGLSDSLEGLKKELEDRRQSVARLQNINQSGSTGFSQYFESLSKNIPDGVWLMEFSLFDGGEGFEFKGQTTDGRLVMGFLEGLSKDDFFENKNFSTLEVVSGGEKSPNIRFVVNSGGKY